MTARHLAILLITLASPLTSEASPTAYNNDIRPILSNNCFRCHGPDKAERKAKTRLDVPGEADLEEVIARITSTDPDEIMPPPESNKALTREQIETLKSWIGRGAEYEQHWAFVAAKKSQLPSGKNAIDQLEPATSVQADKLTLARRVHLDLIGLPPTPEEADAFAGDLAPDAYGKLVDRLLASPRYGERWARRWLDLARYADTNGYEKDRDRSIWPYRDWVIRAINADMPFDQFTIEQLAGDMLPGATPQQRVATGFHRNTMLNEEGGIDPLEFRFHAMTDRVATTGTTWLGLTTGCAQCHTHKYDPITHTDYYGMMAYLNNADEPDYIIPAADADATLLKNLAEADRLVAALPDKWPPPPPASQFSPSKPKSATTAGESKAEIQEDGTVLRVPVEEIQVVFNPREMSEANFALWLEKEREQAQDWRALIPGEASANFPYLIHEGGGVVFAGGDTSKHDIYTLKFAPQEKMITSLRLEALPDERLPDRGPGTTFYEGRKGDFYLTEFKIAGYEIAGATESYAKNKFGSNPVSAKLATDGDIQTGWSVSGRIGERHVAVFVLDKPIPAGQPVELEMHFGRHYASSLGKFRVSASSSASPPVASERDPEADRLLAKESLSEQETAHLYEVFLMQEPQLKSHADRIRSLRKPPGGTLTLVLEERPGAHPRVTHRHHRGEFLAPKEIVAPRLPEAIFPAGEEQPKNRLDFARWLVSDANPLTARVVANRHWAAFFGEGIVRTLDDFGMQGALPKNQPLLDHLAVSLRDGGWSIKKLHREIVLSAAYRQKDRARTRLEAEIIRDAALRAAGILNDKMFGPPVRPPQPAGVTEVAYGSPKWKPSSGGERFRRSLYTYQKRTAPFAMFTTFDAGSGEACIARRDRSNTPLQALTLMNDPMFIEIAQAFGKDIAAGEGDDAHKIQRAFRQVLTRPPSAAELGHLEKFHVEHGDWQALARVLLSLDETVTKP